MTTLQSTPTVETLCLYLESNQISKFFALFPLLPPPSPSSSSSKPAPSTPSLITTSLTSYNLPITLHLLSSGYTLTSQDTEILSQTCLDSINRTRSALLPPSPPPPTSLPFTSSPSPYSTLPSPPTTPSRTVPSTPTNSSLNPAPNPNQTNTVLLTFGRSDYTLGYPPPTKITQR